VAGPVELELRWREGTRLEGQVGGTPVVMDWDGGSAPSPVQALACSLAGCMASDVVIILQRGRQPIRGLVTRLSADRAPTDPRRLMAVRVSFEVQGPIPADKVERAIALSHDTYCSVWHSLRQDIEFRTSFTVVP
jgi:putative redox protein